MTENEAKSIKWMKCVRDDAVVTLDNIAKNEPNVSPMLYAGRKEKAETIIKGFEELEQYRAIGTIEECRSARERQRKAIPEANTNFYRCPNCGEIRSIRQKHNYCHDCGQAFGWRK